MQLVKLEDASKQLGELVKQVRAGNKVVLSDDTGPVAELIAIDRMSEPRKPGLLKGIVDLPDDFFFDPLPIEEEERWWGSGSVG